MLESGFLRLYRYGLTAPTPYGVGPQRKISVSREEVLCRLRQMHGFSADKRIGMCYTGGDFLAESEG